LKDLEDLWIFAGTFRLGELPIGMERASAMPDREATQSTIQRAREGDRGSFDSLVADSRASLEAHVDRRIGRYLRGRVEPEDVLQETYARAWRSIAGFRGKDSSTLLGWLKGIAEHVILDLISRHKRKDIIYVEETPDSPDREPTPSKGLRREERFSRLQKALDGLSPEQREVITLVRIEGLKIKEAASKMHRTPNAATKLLIRALKKLKDAFGDTESLHLPPRGLAAGNRRSHDA
jgi:RNA polymerase sigma-70 factor (ECF subfamily)